MPRKACCHDRGSGHRHGHRRGDRRDRASWAALALSRGLRVVATDPAAGARKRLGERDDVHSATSASPVAWSGLPSRPILTTRRQRPTWSLENGPERLETKRRIFAMLDQHAHPGRAPGEQLVRAAAQLFPGRLRPAPRAGPCGSSLQPAASGSPGGSGGRQADIGAGGGFRDGGAPPWASGRSGSAGSCPDTWRTGSRRPCGAKRTTWSARGWCRWRTSTPRSPPAPDCGGPLLGPFATQHLSGGGAGLEHVLEHLGPPMVEWWRDLGAPELTPALVAALVAGVRPSSTGETRTTCGPAATLPCAS